LPKDASIVKQTTTPVDFIQAFVANSKELEAQAPKVKNLVKPNGMLWICYLKGTAKTKTDINRDTLRARTEIWLTWRILDFGGRRLVGDAVQGEVKPGLYRATGKQMGPDARNSKHRNS
jgi:hypothetical protein